MQKIYLQTYDRRIDKRMLNRILTARSNILNMRTLVNIILVSNAFIWYFLVITILKGITANFQSNIVLQIWILHFSAIALSAIVGATYASKIQERTKFLVSWMILGVLTSSLALLLDMAYMPNALLVSFLLGFSLGIGMPTCMGYFTENIRIEVRWKVGGVIMLSSGLGMILLGVFSEGNANLQGLILTVWRLIGLVSFLLLQKNVSRKTEVLDHPSFRSLVSLRPFILYLVPWIMFSLITYLTIPIQIQALGPARVTTLTMWDNVITGIFAIAGGFLIDSLGRKRMSIIGFALLGTAYAVLGLFSAMDVSWYFYTVIDGIAWGIFYVIFVITIWGDLSQGKSSEKYYALGVLPFFVSNFIRLTIGSSFITIGTSAIFSFSAFFLFLAVLPIVYAPETLPEKVMKDRDLKSYIENAKKKAQKESNKQRRNEKT